ncbi:MAG: hypothetical protein U0269_13690 [Polyangiales bacterium]
MPTSRLEQVLEALQQRVLERYPGVSFDFGEQFIAAHAAPPRVVWVRGDGSVNATSTAGRTPTALAVRHATVFAVCWAARGGRFETDDAACEALMDAVILALREVVGGGATLPFAESWEREAWVKQGRSCRLRFTLLMPVVLEEPTVVATTTIPVDLAFDHDTSADTDRALDADE